VTAREYHERRQRLAQAMPRGAVAVIPAAATAFVTGVIPYVSARAPARAWPPQARQLAEPQRHGSPRALAETLAAPAPRHVKRDLPLPLAHPRPQPYRQDADFGYLTGMAQHAVAVVVGEQGGGSGAGRGGGGSVGEHRFILFIPDPDREVGAACRT
jgi:hypothetical protein